MGGTGPDEVLGDKMIEQIEQFLQKINGARGVYYHEDSNTRQVWKGGETVNVYSAYSLKEITCWMSSDLNEENIMYLLL